MAVEGETETAMPSAFLRSTQVVVRPSPSHVVVLQPPLLAIGVGIRVCDEDDNLPLLVLHYNAKCLLVVKERIERSRKKELSLFTHMWWIKSKARMVDSGSCGGSGLRHVW